MSPLRRVGLQGWLVAAFLGVGMLASLVVLLVVLPTLESSVRRDRAQGERTLLASRLQQALPLTKLSGFPDPAAVLTSAAEIRARTGGEVRIVYRPAPFVRPSQATVPSDGELFRKHDDSIPPAYRVAVPAGRDAVLPRIISTSGRDAVIAAVPFSINGSEVGVVQVIVPVVGAGAALASVQRRVFIAVILVLALAALAGYGLARLIGRRIAALAETAVTLAGGDLAARAEELPPRELAMLGGSLNGMASRLEGLVGELTSERDRARGLIASLAEGVVAITEDDDVVAANAVAERYLNLEQGGPVRLEALPAEVVDAVRAVRRDSEGSSPRAFVAPDGHELEFLVGRLGTEGQGGLVITFRDVTEERQLERARRDLVANVSHELKTPVTALRGFLELLESDRVDPETRREFLASMSRETERLQRLVEEQLQLARLDAGALPLEREDLDLGALAAEIVGPRAPLVERDGLHLSLRLPAERVALVDADPARIEQVILILLDNALRHTPAGGTVTVAVERDDRGATLTVEDDGEGIAAEEQRFVFDRFYRGDASREGRSAGLGLAIARGIVDAHGGTIGLRSYEGAGSTFAIWLPAAESSRDGGATGAVAPAEQDRA